MEKGYRRNEMIHRNDIGGEHPWGDAGQLLLALIFIVGMCVDVFILHLQVGFFDILPLYARLFVAILLFIMSIYLIRSGLNSVFGERRKKLVVIRSGVFSLMRHPVYFGSMLLFLGFVFIFSSILALIIWMVMVVFYLFIARYEEKILIDSLGDEYRRYMKEVPMFIPRSSRRK